MWTKKTRWKVAMRNSGKTLKILLKLIMASNDTWTNKCVLTMTMSHNYGHTVSHLSNCSIVLNVQDVKVGAELLKGFKKCWSPIHFEHCNTNNEISINLSSYFCCFYLLVIVSLTSMNISVKPVNLCTFYFAKFC
jgi:hypothetical protein